jgi:glycerate kinase
MATLRLLIAPDAFKGTYSAKAVCGFLAEGAEAAGAEVDRCPLADGGEGTIDVLAAALGFELRSFVVEDANGRPISAPIGFRADGAAMIECATAIGLAGVPPAERDPVSASSKGLGELISHASRNGANHLLIGVGGTACVDGGAGAVEAIREARLVGCEFEVLCDVSTPWERAAAVFAPQKRATPEQVLKLARRLDEVASSLPRDPRGVPMTGAGGGISGALWAFGAKLTVGADRILDLIRFERRLSTADMVITGEGSLDQQTAEGKLVGRVSVRARRADVRAVAVVGRLGAGGDAIAALGLADVLIAGTPAALHVAGRQLAGAFY